MPESGTLDVNTLLAAKPEGLTVEIKKAESPEDAAHRRELEKLREQERLRKDGWLFNVTLLLGSLFFVAASVVAFLPTLDPGVRSFAQDALKAALPAVVVYFFARPKGGGKRTDE